MAVLLIRALCLLPLLFGFAEPLLPLWNPFETLFPNPFRNIIPQGSSPSQTTTSSGGGNNNNGGNEIKTNNNFETKFGGAWEVVVENAGVSGMHTTLMPNNKVIMYDAISLGPSALKLPEDAECRPDPTYPDGVDCWAHSIEYNIDTNAIRPLRLETNAWCSSGGLNADGNLVSTGGFDKGGYLVRHFTPCEGCDWEDDGKTKLAAFRWYATNAILPDGSFIVIGGRKEFNYEFIPAKGAPDGRRFNLPLLSDTTEEAENNLYPFVYLSPDGNLFIFANDRSILFDYKNDKVVHEFPVLADGARNYPPSGMSALLPIKIPAVGDNNPPAAEVIVCGGSKFRDAFQKAEQRIYMPTLKSCGRITITDRKSAWQMENMPSERTMGDMLILPTGDLLIVNGAKKGTSGWFDADEPNFVPVLYSPSKPKDQRFKELAPTTIPRMYHSSSAVLPDTKILIAGSNANDKYSLQDVKYPTELRIEKFSPPYLDPSLQQHKPEIMVESSEIKLKYGEKFKIQFKLGEVGGLGLKDIKVTMYRVPFTTHGYSMDQRMLILPSVDLVELSKGTYHVNSHAPPSAVLAPPGYHLVFVVHRGVPSNGVWLHIQ